MDAVPKVLSRDSLNDLIGAIRASGRTRVLAPVARDGAIVFAPIQSAAELPQGVHDRQGPGSFRLTVGNSPRCFAWANGPQALKPLSFSPREILWRCERDATGTLRFRDAGRRFEPTAVLGVRACDLAALRLQEQHFLRDGQPDPHYAARRESLFLVAVHCSHPAETCFCASTGDGPRADSGYDLALAELDDGFLVFAGSDRGRAVLDRLDLAPATGAQQAAADAEIAAAAERQVRRLPGPNLRDAVFSRLDHPHWDQVGRRCLSCGNCTAVCPTCFCHAEQDEPGLDGTTSDHFRQWDSCFTAVHSYMGHFLVREETRLRYRQWLSHKLAGWHDQFGRSGCVGCGRCITWCPAGIDLTAEVAALLESPDA